MVHQRRSVLWLAIIFILAILMSCTKEKTQQPPPTKIQWTPTAGVCNLPAAGNCTTGASGNSCVSGGSCNIGLAINASQGVDLTLNGQALSNSYQLVCVPQGTKITWSVSAAHSSFLADFGNATPFSDNNNLTYITGSDTQPASYTATNNNGCYKYNIKVCPVPETAGPGALSCGQQDPKVIVGSGG